MISESQKAQLDKLLNIFDNEFGIASSFQVYNQLHLPIKLGHISIYEEKDYTQNFSYSTSGSCKMDLGTAAIAATCEYLERYSLRFDQKEIDRKSFSEVAQEDNYLSLEEVKVLQGFHPLQFNSQLMGYKKISKDERMTWIKARELISDEPIHIPQEFAIMKGNPYFEVTTSGCAIGRTQEEAILSGLYELFERHFIMQFWWKRMTPLFFDLPAILKKYLPAMSRAYGPWIEQVKLITIPHQLGLPFFVAYFKGENTKRQPSFIMSAACDLNPLQAIERCLSELGGMINGKILNYDKVMAKDYLPTGNFDADIRSFQDHQGLYLKDFSRDMIFFYDHKDTEKVALEEYYPLYKSLDKKAELKTLKEILRQGGYRPFWIDLTTRDIRPLGLHVVRTFDLKTVDINSKHYCRRWGKSALFDEKHRDILDLNPYPHPFP